MKKLLAIFLVISILFTFASCGGNEEEKNINNNDIVENNDSNQQNIENNGVVNNKPDIPAELTADFVKSYPVTDASQFTTASIEGGVTIYSYDGSETIVVVPEEINGEKVIAIDNKAFSMNTEIKAVKIADTITVIGSQAFINCKNLEIVLCGSGLETIEDYAFTNCPAIKYIELNEGLKTINELAISKASMTELYVPASVETINYGIKLNPELKIICEAGSVAETFAKENNFIYEIR